MSEDPYIVEKKAYIRKVFGPATLEMGITKTLFSFIEEQRKLILLQSSVDDDQISRIEKLEKALKHYTNCHDSGCSLAYTDNCDCEFPMWAKQALEEK